MLKKVEKYFCFLLTLSDEGISGTSTKHRDDFNRMVDDARAGKIDIIITKNVSRFARNVLISLGICRELAALTPQVGVFFESECIFSLNEESQMALSFLATIAEEESRTRSRSMETSLRMRLDNGIPLTPKLFGYTHDADKNLVINPDEAPTVKLGFYMYLFGYSSQQIADAFIALGRKSYHGEIKWTANGVIQVLRNERHCGAVFTRKTYTVDFREHKVRKNRGVKPRSFYYDHHEAIISRDDFIAVQRMIDNAKYGNKSILPKLKFIESGMLKGFVTVNPRWGGFTAEDYFMASQSAYQWDHEEPDAVNCVKPTLQIEPGSLDLRGFEVVRSELFDATGRPFATFLDNTIKFSTACVRKFGQKSMIELLVNPLTRKIAIRPTDDKNRSGVCFSKTVNGVLYPKVIASTAYRDTLFHVLGWKEHCRYRIFGSYYEQNGECAYIFDAADSEVYFHSTQLKSDTDQNGNPVSVTPITQTGKQVWAIPEAWTEHFGIPFYQHEETIAALESQNESDWKLKMEGRLFEHGKELNVTGFDELRSYIHQELKGIELSEVRYG